MGGKTKTTQNSTQTNNAYAPVNPVLQQGAGVMKDYVNNPASNAVYQGPRIADMSGDTLSGLEGLRNSSGANTSLDYLTNFLNSPQALEDNPQVKAMQDAIRRQVQATTNSTFSNSGMVGGTQHQGSLAKGLADGMAQPLFAAYENDQARRMQAAGLLPTVDQTIINNRMNAGQVQDSYAQNKINADMQKFEDERTAPIKAWSEVAPLAMQMGSQFGTTTNNSTTTQKTPLGQQLLGGAMAAAGMMTGMPGLGSSIGGLLGTSAPGVVGAPWTATVFPSK